MNKLRELRKQKRLSLRQLAEKVNMSYSNIASIERGEVPLNENTIKMFTEFFGCTSDYLLGNKPELPKVIEVVSYNEDGTITKFQHELLDMTKGFTEDDFKKVNSYIEFIKSKKESENK